MAAEFRLLGDVEALADGQPIAIGYAQLQSVLAVLLTEANQAVSVDQLVDRVWGTRQLPRRPRSAVQHGVSLLRRVLAVDPSVTIAWSSAGYRLTVKPTAVDLHRFHALVEQARNTPDDERAAELFEQALGLWRGEPFAGLDTPWFTSTRATLVQQRMTVQLDSVEVRLRLARHAAVLPELTRLAQLHPLDERVAGQYLLALYRCGRQAQALEHYERLRRHLADHLGADLSPPLQLLHRQILGGDPTLTAPATTTTSTTATRRELPRQLPAGPRLFTGRGRELAALTAALDQRPATGATVVISAIGGTGGIGKTWLALHWAHQHLDRFPDGQLHVNLRGFDPVGQPLPAGTVLRGFLDALGADPGAIPVDLDAQAAMYRSLVAGKRMLIVLDNARDTAQLEPLLPGSPTCTVLVTSRHQLTSLVTAHGAHHVDLGVLTEPEAHELLANHLGASRIAAEPDTAAELLACCAGLPLAISILAARANSHPDFPLTVLADELRERTSRLDALDTGDPTTNLRAVLSWSYHALPAEAAEVFELLGLAPGPDISVPAAASLTTLPTSDTRKVLQTLETAHLVQQHAPGRYRTHDLVRLYAADQAHRRLLEDARHAALWRLVDFYLHTAFAGDRLLDRQRRLVELSGPAPGCRPQPLPDENAVHAWITAEYPNVLASQYAAAEHAWHNQVWQLAWTLDSFHARRGLLHDARAMWQAGLAAAERLGDPAAQIRAHRRLGDTLAELGQTDEALEHLHRALELAEHIEDVVDQAQTTLVICWVWTGIDDERALAYATRALSLFQTLDKPVWEADAHNNVGWCQAQLGQYEQAHANCAAALALFERHPDRHGEADTLDSLGYIAHKTGRFAEARDYYEQSITRFRDLGHAYQEAGCLERLGHTHQALDQHEQARTAWQQALDLYQAQHRTGDSTRVQRFLDEVSGPPPEPR